jgi:hypothetical protein
MLAHTVLEYLVGIATFKNLEVSPLIWDQVQA